jgi:ATP-dependent protease ClpP protease subunit
MAETIEFGRPKVHQNGYFPTKALANVYEFYLTGQIESAETYVEWFDAIRHATEHDVVKIYINSIGGDLFTAIQFMRVLSDTAATVICSVEGACMSAATMIFMCADSFEVTPHSIFMFHNYSGGTIGKGGEMIDQLVHERKWSERLMNEIYQDFLTHDEIQSMLNNKDLWMDGEEVVRRMHLRIASIQASMEEEVKPKRKAPVKKAPAKKPVAKKPVAKKVPAKKKAEAAVTIPE